MKYLLEYTFIYFIIFNNGLLMYIICIKAYNTLAHMEYK